MNDWKKRFSKFIDWNSPRHFVEGRTPDDIIDFISEERKIIVEDILRLIDKIEVENQEDSFDEWREYKHIRNSIVDKFLTNKNGNKS